MAAWWEWEDENTQPDRKPESDSGLWLPLKTTMSLENSASHDASVNLSLGRDLPDLRTFY